MRESWVPQVGAAKGRTLSLEKDAAARLRTSTSILAVGSSRRRATKLSTLVGAEAVSVAPR